MPNWLRAGLGLLVCLALCAGAAAAANYFANFGLGSAWFAELSKPSWTPSVERCGQVWIFLYVAMAIALWQVWLAKGFTDELMPYIGFSVQLILNAGWPALFFAFHDLRSAFLESLMLAVGVLVTLIFFYRVKPAAAVWLIPYALWSIFWAVLNGALWRMNG